MNINMLSGFQMFSLEHFIVISVILLIAVILFLTRKYFIKYQTLDLCFRIVLALLIFGSEIWLRKDVSHNVFLWNLPIPLCGHLLWIASLALLSNSERIYRKIYPLCLVGATLSMIVVEGIPHFPEFRAWQYFLVHGGFFLGALYFVFTRKINKFTFKDYGNSCLLIGAMGAVMSLFVVYGVRDDYMVIHPVPMLNELYNAVGQLGYTLLYLLFIAGLMALFTTITYFLTKHRDDNANYPVFKENKILSAASKKYSRTARRNTVIVFAIAITYLISVQFFVATGSHEPSLATPLAYLLTVLTFIGFAVIIFNEVLLNYEKSIAKKQEKNHNISL